VEFKDILEKEKEKEEASKRLQCIYSEKQNERWVSMFDHNI
jgi:hypothetical protein